MDFGPGLDEALLCARQIAANALNGIEREDAFGILIRRMKVGPVVRGADFHEHSNNDSEESRDLRHLPLGSLSRHSTMSNVNSSDSNVRHKSVMPCCLFGCLRAPS